MSAIPHYLCFALAQKGAPDAIDWVAEQLSRQIPNPVFIIVVVIAVYLASRWTSKIQRERAIQREQRLRERAIQRERKRRERAAWRSEDED